MKRYKLLKDLPTWKAGEIFILKENGNLFWNDNGTEVMIYFSATIEKFGILENKEWFEEIPEEPKSVWDLKAGDSFYLIFNGNILKNSISYCEHFKANYLETWNAFLSEEEAKKELEKRKAIQRIKKYCYENDIKLFSDKEIKEILEKNVGAHYSEVIIFYFIHYKMNFKKFDYSCLSLTRNQECLYFEKEKDIKKVIVNCENDLRIIFNV